MKRVRYLAALAGATERSPAPLLHPPRRLFPHEPPPVEALSRPPQPQASAEGGPADPPTPEPAAAGPRPPGTERVAEEPASAAPRIVSLVQARSPDPATGPVEPAPIASRAAPRVEPPRREAVRAAEAAAPPTARAVGRATDTPRSARDEARAAEPEPKPVSRAPARTTVGRRLATALEPLRLRPPGNSRPERAADAGRPAAAPAQAPALHIGSIDVTVTAPAAAPGPPPPSAPSVPAHRARAPFDPRSASTTSWFGLAQR
jgi:hypothetical protein